MSNIRYDFTNKVAIVTGGASGIGKATVEILAEADAKIVLVDTHRLNGEAMAGQFPDQVMFVEGDVSDPATADCAVGVAIGHFGAIDILVNNAGIEFNDRGNLFSMNMEYLRRIVDVNMWGYVYMMRACFLYLKRGGRIINVSSLQGVAAASPGTIYQATKAAILGLTKAAAIELAFEGITVNSVLPGAIATEGMGAARGAESEVTINALRRRIPIGRRGHAHEVAAAILFLASQEASYITGTELEIGGGMRASLNADNPNAPTPNVPNDPDAGTVCSEEDV